MVWAQGVPGAGGEALVIVLHVATLGRKSCKSGYDAVFLASTENACFTRVWFLRSLYWLVSVWIVGN